MRAQPAAVLFFCAATVWGQALAVPAPAKAPATPAAKIAKPPQASVAARAALRSMNLNDRVAQLIIGVCYGDLPNSQSALYQKYKHWVRDLHLGGLIVNNRTQYGLVRTAEPHTMALFLNQMQKMAKMPLLVGADFERGASMRVSDTAKFPHNMAFGAARDLDASRYLGRATAREARALGVQWIFAPVADVNNNPANPVINIRSYGENPADVAAHVGAFIDGAHSDAKNPVLVSAKHFPGHGDTGVDSHLDLARLEAARERMDEVEFTPFRAAIEHSADTVMTAHMAVSALDSEDTPATVSRRILNGVLREELGFKGIIVTDAMDMGGLAKQIGPGEAAVRALEAGVDVLLMPPDPDLIIRAVVAAVRKGRISKERIDQSALRMLDAKVRLGLLKKRTVDVDLVSDTVGLEADEAVAQHVADHAVTLVRNQNGVLPLARTSGVCLVVSTGFKMSTFGQKLLEEFRARAPLARAVLVDNSLPEAALDAVVGDTAACTSVVFATYTTNPALPAALSKLVERLTAAPVPVIFVSLGNPYLVAAFPQVAGFLATFSTTPGSENAAVKALFGELELTGKLPVSIPGFGQYGEGLTLNVAEPKTQASPIAN